LPDEMKADVNMLGSGMVVVIDSKLDCSLVVTEEGGGRWVAIL